MRIDHVIYGVSDLSDAQRWFRSEFDLLATPGGSHPELGTANAIIPLGPGQYIELMAVADADMNHPLAKFVAAAVASGDRPIGLCLRPDDLDQVAARLDLRIIDMHRETPDGGLVEWRIAGMEAALGPQRLPFFIDWGAQAETLDAANAAAAPDGAIAWVEIGTDREELTRWIGEAVAGLRCVDGQPGVARLAIHRDGTEVVIGGRSN